MSGFIDERSDFSSSSQPKIRRQDLPVLCPDLGTMRSGQFQRFLALYSKKYGLLANGAVFKQTIKSHPKFFIRADKLTLLQLNSLYYEFKHYASNLKSEPTWGDLMVTLKKFTVPAININTINKNEHEHEFLIWVDKLASFVVPICKTALLEEINFENLEEIRRALISFAIRNYHRLHKVDAKGLQAHLPRALAAAMLYNSSQDLYNQFSKAAKNLSAPVTLEALSAEVMLSLPTINKAREFLKRLNQNV